jgi:hypothetical protein
MILLPSHLGEWQDVKHEMMQQEPRVVHVGGACAAPVGDELAVLIEAALVTSNVSGVPNAVALGGGPVQI